MANGHAGSANLCPGSQEVAARDVGMKAADVAVQEAARTLRGITGADVVSMSAEVQDNKISMYRTTVNISFAVER